MLACPYEEFDLYGFSVGIVAFAVAMLYGFYLLQKFDLNRKSICQIFILCSVGHFIGAFALFEYAIRLGADSCFYFQHATTKYQGMGYWFAFMVLGYAKKYLLGESFLGSFLISGAIGLIASTYLVVIYKVLLDRISGPYRFYYQDSKQILFPILLLFCWPSYLFWSAGIIKDNFAFLGIMMTLFVAVQGKLKASNLITLAIAAMLGLMVRPYLFVVFGVSGFMYVLLISKIRVQYKVMMFALLGGAYILALPMLQDYQSMMQFSGTTLKNIGEYAVRQQGYMAIGSSIPVPTHNPYLMFLFIPYLIFANLLLPLVIGARNFIGVVSSIENVYLLWWIVWFVKNRSLWTRLSSQVRILKFLMLYFLVGMTCLSVMCTNLGLAMREKVMYAPALLICMFLLYAYQRILLIKHHADAGSNNESQVFATAGGY